MAILNHISCADGSLGEFDSTAGNVSVSTTYPRYCGRSVKFAVAGSGQDWAKILIPDTAQGTFNTHYANTDIYFGGWIKLDSLPGSGSQDILGLKDQLNKYMAWLTLSSAGKLDLWDRITGPRATGTRVLAAGTEHLIELHVGTESALNAFDAPYSLYIDGVLEFSGTNGRFSNQVYDSIYLGNQSHVTSATFTFYWADVVIDDAATHGNASHYVFVPIGVGSSNTWTASAGNKWDCVDEIPRNADTDYIYKATSAISNYQRMTMQTRATVGMPTTVPVLSVKTLQAVRMVSGVGGLNYGIFSNSAVAQTSSNNDPGTSYVLRGYLAVVDPGTMVDWLNADIDQMEASIRNRGSGTNEARATQIVMTVLVVLPMPASAALKYVAHAGI